MLSEAHLRTQKLHESLAFHYFYIDQICQEISIYSVGFSRVSFRLKRETSDTTPWRGALYMEFSDDLCCLLLIELRLLVWSLNKYGLPVTAFRTVFHGKSTAIPYY